MQWKHPCIWDKTIAWVSMDACFVFLLIPNNSGQCKGSLMLTKFMCVGTLALAFNRDPPWIKSKKGLGTRRNKKLVLANKFCEFVISIRRLLISSKPSTDRGTFWHEKQKKRTSHWKRGPLRWVLHASRSTLSLAQGKKKGGSWKTKRNCPSLCKSIFFWAMVDSNWECLPWKVFMNHERSAVRKTKKSRPTKFREMWSLWRKQL